MRRVIALPVVVCLAVALSAQTRQINPRAYIEHVRFLASDQLEGRGNGTPGLDAAADYIAKQFAAAGLEPLGDPGTFFQRFEMITSLSVQPGNVVSLNAASNRVDFEIGRDYQLGSTTTDPAAPPQTLPVVFAGYGISAPAVPYDDYRGVDATGSPGLRL